jgi:hypothetical protein
MSHPNDPDVLAMRLCLSFDADNGDAYAMTLDQFIGCQSCCAAIITTLITVLLALSDECRGDWRAAMTDQLAKMLGGAER